MVKTPPQYFKFLGILLCLFNLALGTSISSGNASDATSTTNTKHRTIEDATHYPYSAIGTVNWAGISQRSSCTGTLIAEDIIITAAHCLVNQRTDRQIKPGLIHFSAGYQKGEFLAHTTGKELLSNKEFSMAGVFNNDMIEKDWAILRLKDPIGRKTGYLGWGIFNPKTLGPIISKKGKVMVAGYPRDRIHALSTEFKCKLKMEKGNSSILRHSCQLVEGDSGGPIAILYDDYATVIGINSATNDSGVNFAVTLAAAENDLAYLLNNAQKINKEKAIFFTKGRPPVETLN